MNNNSVGESVETIIFYECFFSFFSFFLITISQMSVNQHPLNFRTRLGLVPNRAFSYTDFSKVPFNGAEKS